LAKNDKKRTRAMVYSNVNKKAGKKSASNNNDIIDLDNEIIIGLKTFPEPNRNTKKSKNKGNKSGQPVDNKLKKMKNAENLKTKNENIKHVNKNQQQNQKHKQNHNQNQSEKNYITQTIEFNGEPEKPKLTRQQQIQIQKRRILMKIGIMILLIICLIGGTVYFFLSPIFNVKSIEVTNNTNITSEQIINMSEIKLNENTFKFSKKEAENKIRSNPYVESVDVKRNVFSNKVQINISERTASLMLEYGNSYVYINNQGYILEISTLKLDSPIIKGYVTPVEEVKLGNRLNKDDLERLEVVLKILEAAEINGLEKLITHIDISDKKDFTMVMESEDKTVYLGTCSDISTQMLYVKEMIEREKGKEGEFFVNKDLNTSNPVFREKV